MAVGFQIILALGVNNGRPGMGARRTSERVVWSRRLICARENMRDTKSEQAGHTSRARAREPRPTRDGART